MILIVDCNFTICLMIFAAVPLLLHVSTLIFMVRVVKRLLFTCWKEILRVNDPLKLSNHLVSNKTNAVFVIRCALGIKNSFTRYQMYYIPLSFLRNGYALQKKLRIIENLLFLYISQQTAIENSG